MREWASAPAVYGSILAVGLCVGVGTEAGPSQEELGDKGEYWPKTPNTRVPSLQTSGSVRN